MEELDNSEQNIDGDLWEYGTCCITSPGTDGNTTTHKARRNKENKSVQIFMKPTTCNNIKGFWFLINKCWWDSFTIE